LTELLAGPLPGWRAQTEFQPELSYGRHFGPPPATARSAAVVVLLYPQGEHWYLPLTLRPETLTDHPGQISLPGGSVQLGEQGQDAALRELNEELGVVADSVRLLGELSPLYVFNSNYHVSVWLAVALTRPRWRPHAAEVAELFEIPLAHLMNPANRAVQERTRYGVCGKCPGFLWGKHHIWGFTSMVLAEVVSLARRAGGA
jgi:8-oxo-dGTP pyrophosphatase MutT (NUDIX family)